MPCLWHPPPLQLSTVNCQLSVFSSLTTQRGPLAPTIFPFTKNSHLREVRVRLVDQPGFEPRQTVPKTVVLPLHHWSSSIEVAKIQFFSLWKKKKKKFLWFYILLIFNILISILDFGFWILNPKRCKTWKQTCQNLPPSTKSQISKSMRKLCFHHNFGCISTTFVE